MSTLTLATLVVIALVLVFFVLPLRMSWRSKGIIALITIIAPCKSYLHLIVGGDTFDPNIPYNLSFVFDIARTTIIFLALLALLRLGINLIYRIVHLNWRVSLLPTGSLFHAQLMVIVSFVLACYGTSCAYGSPELKRYEYTLERLDPRLEGMKIVMLSDIHISTPTDANVIYQLVQDINALKPDLILMPGDLMDGSLHKRRPISDLLFGLKAKFGIFISAGNHEYYSGYEEWRRYFEQGGFISLDNKVVALKDSDGKTLLNLGGLTDPRAERYDLPTPDVTGVVAALDDSAPSIILSHRPQYAVDLAVAARQVNAQRAATIMDEAKQRSEPKQPLEFPTKQVNLVLSGHTHGGLVYGLRQLVANANGGFVSGHYQIDKTHLVVGNGTMVWMGFPLRLGVPSQIVVITLHSQQPKGVLPLPLSQRLTAVAEVRRAEALAEQSKKEQEQLQQRIATHGVTASLPLPPEPKTEPNDVPDTSTDETESTEASIDSYSLAPSDDIKPSGSVTHTPRELSNIELIMPMVDAETGMVTSAVTKLALLPERISKDQLRRINEILAEQPVSTQEQAQQERAAELQDQGLRSDPKSGVTVVLLKDAPVTKAEPEDKSSAAQPAAAAQDQTAAAQPATTQPAVAAQDQTAAAPAAAAQSPNTAEAPAAEAAPAPAEQRGQLQLMPREPELSPTDAAEDNAVEAADAESNPDTEEEKANQMTADEDNALMSLGPISEATSNTLELQAEYAISLDPSREERHDSTVSDLLPEAQAQDAAE